MAAEHCWSLGEDLAHGYSNDLDLIREKNLKTFERSARNLCGGKIRAEVVDYLYLPPLHEVAHEQHDNVAKMVCQDVCPHHSLLALFSPFGGPIFVCLQLQGGFDVPRTNEWISYISFQPWLVGFNDLASASRFLLGFANRRINETASTKHIFAKRLAFAGFPVAFRQTY